MASPAQPRKCLVTKEDGKGYGFFLRVEKGELGHLIRTVEKGSSADTAGLKDGDRVLRVNGTFVDDQDHNEVVDLIKKSGNSVTLLVLDEVAYENAKKKGEDLTKLSETSTQPNASQPAKQDAPSVDSSPKPRICYMIKDGGSYGFSLKSKSGHKGISFGSLAANGAAAKAGARLGDRIIELNGKNVENDSHGQITSKVKESGASVAFLLVDKETDDYFTTKKLKITADKANLELLPSKPRIVDLKKEAGGYGFCLRQEKKRRGHFIVEIDAGSSAEKAKLKDFDRVVAVNGESVENFEHEQVVDAIRKGGDKTALLIVDKNTDEIYTKVGVSPYLYLKGLKKNDDQKDHTPSVTPSTKPAPAPTEAKPVITPVVASPDPKYKPRLCLLQKSTNGYGFHLNAIKEVPGSYIKQVVKGGSADIAGLKEDDILLEINSVNVEKDAYDDVVMKIKNAGGDLTLLVISQDAYDYFKSQKIPITSSMADPLPKKDSTPSNTEKNPTGTTEKAPSGTADKAPSGTADIAPSGTADKTPSGTADKAPSGTTDKAPSGTADKVPSGTTEKDPSGTTEKAPSGTTEKAPSGTTEKAPSGTAEKAPSGTTEKAPSGTTEKAPSGTTEKAPSSTTEKDPSSTTEKAPSSTTEKAPSNTTEKAPSNTTEKAPSSTTEKAPSSTTEKAPSSTTEKAPSSTTEKAPSSTTEKAPSSTTEKAPSSTTEKAPSSKAKSAPENTEMVANSTSEKKSEQAGKDDDTQL